MLMGIDFLWVKLEKMAVADQLIISGPESVLVQLKER